MKRSRACNTLLCVLIFFVVQKASAQSSFSYKAGLFPVAQSGFYNISLPPPVMAKCRKEADDVRIFDANQKEIPYILYTETARPNEESFTEFPVSYSGNRNEVIINNILPNSLSKLYLLIKNSEASRTATLSGSDDGEQWFAIKENFVLQNEYTASGDAFVQSVSFPPSNYKYFRIAMQGKNMLPLNILKAGVYRRSFLGNLYDTVPSPSIVQKDSSDKRSYIYLSFPESYQIDKLSLSFSGARYYKRPFALFDQNTINAPLVKDTFSSQKPAEPELHTKTNRLLLVIANGDNAPLVTNAALAFQLHTSVTAYLDSGEQYALYFGNDSVPAPSYDLQYFNDSIGSNIRPLALKKIELVQRNSEKSEEPNSLARWLLWGIIIAVLALLIYFSYRMIKDIPAKTNDDVHL